MSKIKTYRRKLYAEMVSNLACELILSRDGKHLGLFYSEEEDYVGEAGRSSRIKVLWADGSLTTCALKGMRHVGCWRIV